MANIITYRILSDKRGRLKAASKIACNFWNRFIEPGQHIVLQLRRSRWMLSNAVSKRPWTRDGVKYCSITFNTWKLGSFTPEQIAGTMVHEIGHTLGFGWDDWNTLFDKTTGKFTPEAIAQLPALADMEVEMEGGEGTALSHWDETLFDSELMSGYKDSAETVLPVTIDVMGLMGHNVRERLPAPVQLDALLQEVKERPFPHRDIAESIDRDYFEATPVFEKNPAPDLILT